MNLQLDNFNGIGNQMYPIFKVLREIKAYILCEMRHYISLLVFLKKKYYKMLEKQQ